MGREAGSTDILRADAVAVKAHGRKNRARVAAWVRRLLKYRTPVHPVMPTQRQRSQPKHLVLILSSDAVAGALVGALVETLGYDVRFYEAPEDPTDALRRARPDVAMVDGEDRLMISEAVLGHAAMRDIGVVIFGSREAIQGIRELVQRHRIHTLIAPPSLEDTRETLSLALAGRD